MKNLLFLLPFLCYKAESFPIVDVTVDLAKEDQRHAYRMGTRVWHGFMYIAYYPTAGYRVTQINYEDQVLWKKSDNPEERLYNFKFYYLYGDLRVGFIHVFNGEKYVSFYFKKVAGTWVPISFDDLEYLVEKMKRCRDLDVNKPVVEEVFSVQEYSPSGIPAFICMPWPGYVIQLVRADESRLWEAKDDSERCEHVVLHGPKDEPKLVHMFIAMENAYKVLYFEKVNEEWKEVDKEKFYERLQSLDEETPMEVS
ncbi:signal peptide-containing protein [Theileria equi strain WA]|uniref:Signal peptide-containing protein n=1 Tax=Theileria equi strain WA TaxID=1537102 RepID=L0AXD9_THEEQ|nr:signal peptide-containing protein [Theileria equi strain WA]AFZ79893.1 signal peptide-containing protein [Theileria equi strain WA]|eukprot:XP_004829559.1 signal peptide-containing protein [Theileria equi strain WA]